MIVDDEYYPNCPIGHLLQTSIQPRSPMQNVTACPNCGSSEIYMHTKGMPAGGGYAPYYLAGLGRFLHTARFYPAVCEQCGLTRFFAEEDARKKLRESDQWHRCS